ncbi:hypothetical protein J2S39_001938 [Corynebacterium guangdongense]|uniref:HNH nuclease domain-containing protein n=2 Tax=Corynebacterium guangdongense TaxID=1783348 RepID=A0ABU1ZZA5_9CORY|nr:hypothetical protein [Corynebacterium guangdongense]
MALLDSIRHLQRHGMDLLQEVVGLSTPDLMRRGLPRSVAASWRRAADTWFGPTRSPRKQADAVRLACRNGHSLDTLRMIDRHARSLVDASGAWALRRQLCALSGTYEDVDKQGRARVAELNAAHEPAARRSLSVSHRPARRQSTLHYTDAEHVIAGIRAQLRDADDPARAFHDLVLGGGANTPQLSTTAIIALDDLDEILRANDGAGDTLIGRTDGSRMTGRDYVQAKFAEHDFAVLVHPLEGPVDAYRLERFANEKQRLMLAAENPVCPWEGCGKPADKCQGHHLDGWVNGAETNVRDMSMACRYHNGVNDDDPNAPPRRGRLARIGGQIHWCPPGGGRPRLNMHPTARLGAMRIILPIDFRYDPVDDRWMATVTRLVLPLRILLAVVFLGLLVAQFLSFPGEFRSSPPSDPWRWPQLVFWEAAALCLQIVIICIWRLLTLIQQDRIFTAESLRWVDVIVWTFLGGWSLLASVNAALIVHIYRTPELRDPGMPMMLIGITLIGAVLVLLIVVMRELLRRAAELRTDLAGVI